MLNIFKDYHIIKKCDLQRLFNLINDLKQDVINLTNDNQELKELVLNLNKCECHQENQLNNIVAPGNDANDNNIINGNDAQDNKTIQDLIYKEFNLSVINDKEAKDNKRRFYYKSNYLFYANPKYYNLLNIRFNELMNTHKNEPFNKIKQLLKSYLLELEAKDI